MNTAAKPSSSLLDRLLPRRTLRRLLVSIAYGFLRNPAAALRRLGAENRFLFRHMSLTQATCCICGHTGPLFYNMPDPALRQEHGIGLLRETVNCRHCDSTLRQRALARVLLDEVATRAGHSFGSITEMATADLPVRILDSDAFSPISKLMAGNPNYVRSQFRPDRPFGEMLEPNLYNIDLQNISFADVSFDMVLTSDVMEHVPDDELAHREIRRCLKSGGAYLFTVPYNEDAARHRTLIARSAVSTVFLTRPHYHGDPLTGGILAWRIYGREIFADFRNLGFDLDFRWLNLPDQGIFCGDVFVASRRN